MKMSDENKHNSTNNNNSSSTCTTTTHFIPIRSEEMPQWPILEVIRWWMRTTMACSIQHINVRWGDHISTATREDSIILIIRRWSNKQWMLIQRTTPHEPVFSVEVPNISKLIVLRIDRVEFSDRDRRSDMLRATRVSVCIFLFENYLRDCHSSESSPFFCSSSDAFLHCCSLFLSYHHAYLTDCYPLSSAWRVRVFLFCAKDYFISIAIFILDDGFCLNRQETFLFFFSVDMMTDTALQQQTDPNNRTLVTEQERQLCLRNLYESTLSCFLADGSSHSPLTRL